jgi:hypothetical protein
MTQPLPPYDPNAPRPRMPRKKVISGLAAAGLAILVVILIFGSHISHPGTGGTAPETVTYEVWGSAATVTYGSSGSSLTGSSPMKVTQGLQNPAFYALTAQLQGGGVVHCEIGIDGKVVAESVTTGGYNIAQCEMSRSLTGDWESDN